MSTPNPARPNGPEAAALSLEGMPTLAMGRLPEDFPEGGRFVYLFDPMWRDEEPELVTGTITDADAHEGAFRLWLPLDVMSEVLGEEARLLRGETTTGLDSFQPSELPDLPRQIMLNRPELRSRMPAAGHVTLETPGASVPRIIGIQMNDNSLIPESAMPLLQRDEDFRAVWLLDGPDDLERREALERAIHDWSPREPAETEEPVFIDAERPQNHEPKRARLHSRHYSGKVGRRPDLSTETFSGDRA
jgi:hypothetical protein